MSDNEKMFSVKNSSERLIHLGGVMILPEVVTEVPDDVDGVNRKSVELSEYLSVVTDQPNEEKKESVKSVAKTPTGAGWSSK